MVFSTAGVPAARRVELWEAHNAVALVGLNVHATAPLRATEVNVQLSGLRLARVAASAHVVERDAAMIGRVPADSVAVYLTLRGDAWFRQQDSTLLLRPGSALVCETDRPFARGFSRGLEELVVTVPHTAIDAPVVRRPLVAEFGKMDLYATALAKLAARATRRDCPVRPDELTVRELVAVLITGTRAARPAAYRAAARSFIEDNLTDPGLGADQVAAAVGISGRHLSRVFADGGTSVPRHILSRRLELAHSMLASRAGDSVAAVAARCGFVSGTYFSHVFRGHYGQRAGDVLRSQLLISATSPAKDLGAPGPL
jgi:AraC-like DNA-binding protein